MMMLGVLVAVLMYAGIEIQVLQVLMDDMPQYQESIFWRYWDIIRSLFGGVLVSVGLWSGLIAGRSCWQILYVEERYGKPRW